MSAPLTAQDLWPLVQKLPRAEWLRLVAMASTLQPPEARTDAERYAAAPVLPGEVAADASGLDWDAEGWEELSGAG